MTTDHMTTSSHSRNFKCRLRELVFLFPKTIVQARRNLIFATDMNPFMNIFSLYFSLIYQVILKFAGGCYGNVS